MKPNLRKFQALEAANSGRLFSKLMIPEAVTFYTRSGSEGPMYPGKYWNFDLNMVKNTLADYYQN